MLVIKIQLDLKNAFGSVGHNVIDFTLEWYHWPESVRKVIHSYYKELYVQVQTKQYSTSWIKIEKGLKLTVNWFKNEANNEKSKDYNL